MIPVITKNMRLHQFWQLGLKSGPVIDERIISYLNDIKAPVVDATMTLVELREQEKRNGFRYLGGAACHGKDESIVLVAYYEAHSSSTLLRQITHYHPPRPYVRTPVESRSSDDLFMLIGAEPDPAAMERHRDYQNQRYAELADILRNG
jgi:hypothetical protein